MVDKPYEQSIYGGTAERNRAECFGDAGGVVRSCDRKQCPAVAMALKLGKCRLCLKLGDFYSIFSVDSSTQLSDMAMACAQVKIAKGDGLPDKVCGECVEKLSSAYIFKQQCERSDQELRRNYVPPAGFSHTPPPNRQSSDSGYSNRTDGSFQPKLPPEEPPPSTSSAPSSRRKRKRDSDETGRSQKSLLKESFSINVASPAISNYSRPKTPDKRPRYEVDSDYEYTGATNYSADSDSDSTSQIKCKKCDRSFPSKTSLAMHNRIHIKEEKNETKMAPDVFVEIPQTNPDLCACTACGKTFKLQIMLKRHLEMCPNKPSTVAEEPTTPDSLTCKTCNMQFKGIANLVKHMNVAHVTAIKDSPPAIPAQNFKDPEPVPCLFCSEEFNYYYDYTGHFNNCSNRRKIASYDCPMCTSRSIFKGNFFRHLKDKHLPTEGLKALNNSATPLDDGHDTFECRICNKKFATQDLLVTHLAAHMSNIDDGFGTQTPNEGSVVSTLEDTASMHSEASAGTSQQQTCQYCDKIFTYRKSLLSHIATKHSAAQLPIEVKIEPPDVPYNEQSQQSDEDDDGEFGLGETDNTCDICEKTFSYRRVLLQHKLKKHTATAGHKRSTVNISKCTVECLICDITMQVQDIKVHNQTHMDSGIKPKNRYTCSECSGTFKGMDSLRNHIKFVHRLQRSEPVEAKYEVTNVANFCEVVVTKSEPLDVVQGHNDCKSVPGEIIDGVKPVVDLSGFTCPICNKMMPTLISLKRHINWHNNVGNNIEKKHQCNICNIDFKFKSHYTLHMKDHLRDTNLDPKFLTCKICNRKSKHLRAAQMHSNWHKQTRFSNKDYECSICKKIFAYRKVYLSHMAVHFKKGDSIDTTSFDVSASKTQNASAVSGETHQCPHCQKILDSAVSLKCHIVWHKSKASLFGARYECHFCKLKFTNKRRHELHVRTHYEDENGPFKCPTCGKGYNHEKYFSSHVKGHNFDHQSHEKKKQRLREKRRKKVQCPICCRYYPDLLHLVRHLRRSHPQSKMVKTDPDALPPTRFSCKLCAKTFLDEKRLQFHEESHLRKLQHIRCKFCGMKNKNMKHHNVHVKGHLTKKYRDEPLKCSLCEETFVIGYSLHHHLRDVHGVNETWMEETAPERMMGPLQELQCSLCFKILSSRSYFERHIDYHNTLRCNYCFEYFNGKVFLEGHLAFACEKRKLLGETEVFLKRIKCRLCFKAFHLQVKLECHLWTQHGEREFEKAVFSKEELVCDYCFRVFDNPDTLAGHKVYHRSVGFYGCLYCKKKFNTISLYKKHKNHHLAQLCIVNPVKCEHCEEKFHAFRDFIYHMRDTHGDDKEWMTMPKESIEEECGICQKRFFNLPRHLRYHEENRCSKCRMYFHSRADFDSHLCEIESDDEIQQSEDGPRSVYEECDFCFKPITKRESRLKHDKIHKSSGSISCRFCPNKFKTIDSFNIHAFSHRNRKYKKNPLICPYCREKFVAYGPFVKHIRSVHDAKQKMHYRGSILPESCVVCQRSLPNLHNHYRAHIQNKCHTCNKYFVSSKLFEAHSCDKEDSDPSKVFKCDANLYDLINSYIPKEEHYENKYYGHVEDETLDGALEETPMSQGLEPEVRAFSEGTPVISGVLSLHRECIPSKPPAPDTNGAGCDSDDDCVVVLMNDNGNTNPVTVTLDD